VSWMAAGRSGSKAGQWIGVLYLLLSASAIVRSSPLTNVAKLRCPLFLFHADDDTVVPVRETAAFAEELQQTNSRVTFVRVPKGNHYGSMIQQGIPHAIDWLASIPFPD
jgi:dipeptidyl aminopeptidase/acylaminoacyl peptidase